MKLKKTLATLLLAATATLPAAADTAAKAIVIVPPAESGTTRTMALTTETEITFGERELAITNGDDTQKVPYAEIGEILFTDPSGVNEVTGAQEQYRLQENPVGDMLTILGHDGTPAALAVYSQNGAVIAKVPEWNGEQLEVSRLASGMYIVTINRQAIKFIKK